MLLAGGVEAGLIVPVGSASTGRAGSSFPTTPQWQVNAGGKMEFDVVSVKPDTAEPSRTTVNSNIPLGPMDAFSPTGGLLSSTNWPLLQYIVFAYKLDATQVQESRAITVAQVGEYGTAMTFRHGKVAGNPTKDQFRLMMQALLAERFKLAIHYETKQLPVYALVLDKPGKLGPQIQKHPDDVPCSTAVPAPGDAGAAAATAAGGFPANCGALAVLPSKTPGRDLRAGARNLSLSVFDRINEHPAVDRRGTGLSLDRTGLTGNYDFFIEFTPMINGPLPPGANFTPDPNGPTFLEALKEQLGIKLESQTGPVDFDRD